MRSLQARKWMTSAGAPFVGWSPILREGKSWLHIPTPGHGDARFIPINPPGHS